MSRVFNPDEKAKLTKLIDEGIDLFAVPDYKDNQSHKHWFSATVDLSHVLVYNCCMVRRITEIETPAHRKLTNKEKETIC